MQLTLERIDADKIGNNRTVNVLRGEYHIRPEDCVKYVCNFSNNDRGEKTVRFLLRGLENVVLDGNGSTLVIHGRITPFLLDGCKNVTIRNFNVEYAGKYHIEALLEEVGDGKLCFNTGKYKGNYEIVDKTVRVYGENFESRFDDGITLMQEFDAKTCAPMYNGALILAQVAERLTLEEKTCMNMNLFGVEKTDVGFNLYQKGIDEYIHENSVFIMSAEKRLCQVIGINSSEKVNLSDLNIYNSPAMGIICQLSSDITLTRVRVRRKDESSPLVTTLADATHFVNCYGLIKISDCVFENMMDDAVNIHGIYTEVCSAKDNTLTLKLRHGQQAGFLPYAKCDRIRIYNKNTIESRGEFTVSDAKLDDDFTVTLFLAETVQGIEPGDHAENITKNPDVSITRVKTGRNRPRGFLLSSSGKVEVSDCEFYNCAQAIFIAGDTTFWFEAGSVRDVCIKDNVFYDCNYTYDDYPVEIRPEFAATEGKYYHGNVRICNNRFCGFTGTIVKAYSVDGLVVEGNRVLPSGNYKKRADFVPVDTRDCKNVKIQD